MEHYGPKAQDFRVASGLNGTDDKDIATVDVGGVALAAIQGLNEKVEKRSAKSEVRLRQLEVENAALNARLERLETLLRPAPPILRECTASKLVAKAAIDAGAEPA